MSKKKRRVRVCLHLTRNCSNLKSSATENLYEFIEFKISRFTVGAE